MRYMLEALVLFPLRWKRMAAKQPNEKRFWLDFCWSRIEGSRLQLLFKLAGTEKVDLNVLGVQIWLFTFPPPLYSVKQCHIHRIRRQKVSDP